MSKAESTKVERRMARRYRIPGSARVFWGGDGVAVTIADMSAGGCLVVGPRLPEVGTRVFLSLDIGGLPNVRLPAITVRVEARARTRFDPNDEDARASARARNEGEAHGSAGANGSNGAAEERIAAVRFAVPAASVGGLDQLLAQHVENDGEALAVLLVDGDERSRERIAHTIRAMGARVFAVASAARAMRDVNEVAAAVVLARADVEGLAALSGVSHERPSAFRVAFGRKPAVDSALAHGIAQAAADDPCSPKCLGEVLRRRSVPPA